LGASEAFDDQTRSRFSIKITNMKSPFRHFILLIIMFFSAFVGKAQKKDFSIIHFMATKVDRDKYYAKAIEDYLFKTNYKVYLNDRLVTSVAGLEELKIKMYSKGRNTITISAQNEQSISLTIDVLNGEDCFVVKSEGAFGKNDYFKEVESTEWSLYRTPNRVVEVEEDVNNPWGKLDNSQKSGKGQGSCFVLSANGYLITNYHCIENAKEITVKGIDGDLTTKYGATVVASDPSNDLAILKIGNKNVKFNVPSYGFRSSGVAQAEKVYALGFPAAAAMGTEVKITEGIISAKSGVGGDISKFQISAAVNPGNSGGPLIDEQGNLIGVIFAKSTIAESAGYAIKASYLETFLKNVDGFEFPTFVNSMKDKPFTEKVADWKNYIFIVETN
jgi:S1-C subfamily serine protease